MGFFDKFFDKKKPQREHVLPEPTKTPPVPKVKKPKQVKQNKISSPKEEATKRGEPFVTILSVDIDPNNVNNGSFELDWNEKFVKNLIKSGYKIREDDTDELIVDRWFQTVCRNIALELYEQQQADPDNRYRVEPRMVQSKDIGDGMTEVS